MAQTTRTQPGTFKAAERIVVPVAGTDREFLAQQWAVELAAALGAPVRALHVAPAVGERMQGVFAFLDAECRKWGVKLSARSIAAEDVVEEVIAELNPRDLVVIGTRRLAASPQYHVGSVAAELIRRAPCPVQVLRLD